MKPESYSEPDYKNWAARESWKLAEAACLSVGLDPILHIVRDTGMHQIPVIKNTMANDRLNTIKTWFPPLWFQCSQSPFWYVNELLLNTMDISKKFLEEIDKKFSRQYQYKDDEGKKRLVRNFPVLAERMKVNQPAIPPACSSDSNASTRSVSAITASSKDFSYV